MSRFRDEDAYSASRRCHNRFSFFTSQLFCQRVERFTYFFLSSSLCVPSVCHVSAPFCSLKACKKSMKNLDIAHKHYVRYHVHDVQSPLFGETVHKSLSEELAAMNPQFSVNEEDCQWECSFEMSWFQSNTCDWMHISRPTDTLKKLLLEIRHSLRVLFLNTRNLCFDWYVPAVNRNLRTISVFLENGVHNSWADITLAIDEHRF